MPLATKVSQTSPGLPLATKMSRRPPKDAANHKGIADVRGGCCLPQRCKRRCQMMPLGTKDDPVLRI
ncbi:hypothetical protein DPMN_041648 [Dreissena polymorpha]|uniref:Uncharacterized protein n=1 Tax=Dreissena polymorpha TaxID=45954 RepID=A0A9D4CZQ2_DREPO|nr:hypothetical protein DPMN_041648 [Dreissena polymorpha]